MNNLFLTTHTIEELTELISQTVKEAIKNSLPVNSTPLSEKLLTRKETSEKLKISLVTLNDWSKRGIIQSYIIGGRVLYKDSEIEASLHKTKSIKY